MVRGHSGFFAAADSGRGRVCEVEGWRKVLEGGRRRGGWGGEGGVWDARGTAVHHGRGGLYTVVI